MEKEKRIFAVGWRLTGNDKRGKMWMNLKERKRERTREEGNWRTKDLFQVIISRDKTH